MMSSLIIVGESFLEVFSHITSESVNHNNSSAKQFAMYQELETRLYMSIPVQEGACCQAAAGTRALEKGLLRWGRLPGGRFWKG